MKRRSAIRNLLVAGAASLVPRLPGQTAQNDQPGFTIHSDVRLVVLDVSVKDRAGGFVTGLSKENFQILENNVPQPITVFAHEDLPVTAGILVDESQSMAPKRAEVLSAADALIVAGNPKDEVFVLNFNETVRRGLPQGQLFSDDPEQLSTALYRGRPLGRTALYDAVIEGLEQLEMGHRDKKALILISDGGDNMSRQRRDTVFEKLDRSSATIYTIGVYDSADQDRSPGILKHLAGVSGGEAFFPENLSDLNDVCKGIAREIRTRYSVGYVPKASNGGPIRSLHVHVSAPARGKLIARTRTRYRYEDPAAPGSK
jgi:Ca-activated chloride channel family protein